MDVEWVNADLLLARSALGEGTQGIPYHQISEILMPFAGLVCELYSWRMARDFNLRITGQCLQRIIGRARLATCAGVKTCFLSPCLFGSAYPSQ
jgi:hypothetical protein